MSLLRDWGNILVALFGEAVSARSNMFTDRITNQPDNFNIQGLNSLDWL